MKSVRTDGIPKTIMYILTDASMGGSAQSLVDMLKEIGKRYKAVVVIPKEGIVEKYLRELNVKYYIIPFSIRFCKIGASSRRLEDTLFKEDYSAALQLQSIIAEEKVDLIHTNSSVCNVGAIAALLAGKPHIWHLRELLEEHFECEFIDSQFKQELFQFSEAIIAISNCVKNSYKYKFGISSVCIYNGLDLGRFIDHNASSHQENTFLLAGRISEGKGQWDAVRAIELLTEKGITDVQLTLVGDSEQKTLWSIKKYINNHELDKYIHIIPFQKDLSELRRKHNYSLTCSKMEALGRVTIEAMLFGNIVIGADTGGTFEIIGANNERGYSYRQGDYRDLAEVMQKVIMTEQLEKDRKREKAKQYVCETFNLRSYIKTISQLYDEVISYSQMEISQEKDKFVDKMKKRYADMAEIAVKKCNSNSGKKFETMFRYTEIWLRLQQQGFSLSDYFFQNGLKSIAIYGMGFLGCDLYDELAGKGIEICYVMDRMPETIGKVVSVKNMDDELPYVDAIVITVVSGGDMIQGLLEKKFSYTIVKLSEILEFCLEMIY